MIRLALVALLSVACATGPELRAMPMSRQEILLYGTRHYRATPNEVYKAALGALRALNYEIANESPDKGVIVSARKVVRVAGVVWGGQVLTHSRQYVLRLFTDAESHDVVVSALPKVFEGDREVSAQPVWNLEDERRLWRELFAQMDLVVTPAAPR